MLIQVSSDTQTSITFAAGDQIQVDAGATVATQGDAILGPDGATGAVINVLGSVQSGQVAIHGESGGHTIAIGAPSVGTAATVSGNEGGVVLDIGPNPTGGNTVDNYGVITTSSTIADGIGIYSSNNTVTNAGTITSAYGIVLGTTDAGNNVITSNNTIINTGAINATFGVSLWGDGSVLKNSGSIKSFLAVTLVGSPLGTITVENFGTIESTGAIAIQGSTGAEVIKNAGEIKKSIFLGGGNDLYDGRAGTVSSGRVELELGNDIAYGGAATDRFYGGDGNDTLEGGGGDDILDGGAGIDTAVFSGSAGAAVYLASVAAPDPFYPDQQDTGYGSIP
jgi:Ca2+-binding RTX toxin-like protein